MVKSCTIPSHIEQLADKEKNKLLQFVESYDETFWLAYLRGKEDNKVETKIKIIDRMILDLKNILNKGKVRINVSSLLEEYEEFRNDLIKEL